MRRCLFALVLALGASCASPAATRYVSPQGQDTNDGLGPSPTRALRTLQAAVDQLQPGDTLLIAGGTYRETVVFPRSGDAGHPITLKPYQDGKVIVSGCEPVGGWTLHDARKNIWRAPMPWTLGTGRNQVFAGGQVLIEARHPNQPGPGLGMYVEDLGTLWPTFGVFSIPLTTIKDQPGRIVSPLLNGAPDDAWKGALYVGVHYEGWSAQTGVIESSRSGEMNVGDRTPFWWFGTAYGISNAPEEGRGMIVGHLRALDQPGECCWQDQTLYLIPPPGQPPADIEAKRRQVVLDLSGRAYLRLEGLTIHGASARLADSACCTFERCQFEYITHFVRMYGQGSVEHDRDTVTSGETGIFVSGHDNAFLSCSVRISAGAGFQMRGYHQTIHNCLIEEIDYAGHYFDAISMSASDARDDEDFLTGGHVITYNTMRNVGRHFFSFPASTNHGTTSRAGPGLGYLATLFAHNHLYNGLLLTKDGGFLSGYYASAGTLDGLNSQVAFNVMHDSYDTAAMRWDKLGIVYLDAGTSNVDLHDNLLWAAPGSLQHGLWYNTECVDVHERDNVFLPNFTRTCAELTAADFPRGQPFRFGHDFANVPPLPVWPQLEHTNLPGGRIADGLIGGAAFDLGTVDFGQGWQSAVMSFASGVKQLNADVSARQAPRHQKALDPLLMEVGVNDGLEERIKTRWQYMYNLNDGAWIRFNRVPLGEGYRRFQVIYGNEQVAPRTLEVHLDRKDGPVVATVRLPQTDVPRRGSFQTAPLMDRDISPDSRAVQRRVPHIQIYSVATGEVSLAATGTHDLFLVFRSPDGQPVGEFEYFRFEEYRGLIPLQRDEVKLELRLDGRDGPKIGELYPHFTGETAESKTMVATLEPAQGRHQLFLVVRSALPGALGRIDGIRLEKARQPMDVSALGVPPLLSNGRLVLPAPTNRPIPR